MQTSFMKESLATPVIPKKTVYRLSIYQRCLQRLIENDVSTVSSESLAGVAGVKPTQLRKDLAHFGQFGTRGLGYNVKTLVEMIRDALGRNRLQPVVLVGAGNLGSALLRYSGFQKEGFEILAAFDIAAKRGEPRVDGVPIIPQHEMSEFVNEYDVRMAILAVPMNAAQGVVDQLVAAGVQAILNFSPTVVDVPDDVMVKNVDLAVELENLSYFVRN